MCQNYLDVPKRYSMCHFSDHEVDLLSSPRKSCLGLNREHASRPNEGDVKTLTHSCYSRSYFVAFLRSTSHSNTLHCHPNSVAGGYICVSVSYIIVSMQLISLPYRVS